MQARVILSGCLIAAATVLIGAAAVPPPTPAADSKATAAELTPEQKQFFETKIRPIFSDHCYKCHSAADNKTKGGLTLDTRDGLLKGGEDGPILVAGNPDQSAIIKAVRYTDPDLQMPPKGEKLNDQQIADLTEWVKMGAPDPRLPGAPKLTGLTDKARAHWAYQPVQD